MDAQLHVNQYLVTDVEVRENSPECPDLIVLKVDEVAGAGHVTRTSLAMDRRLWQQVANQLAALGVVAEGFKRESIVCMTYPNCDREHVAGMGGTPVHPPADAIIIPADEPHPVREVPA